MPSAIDLSIVICCYNEEQYLEAHVAAIRAVLEATRYRYELVFVEDQSTDSTRDIVARITAGRDDCTVIYHEHNQGRGRTATDGIRAAKGTYVGFIDIDLETPAIYIPHLVQTLEAGADVATAWRIYRFHVGALGRFVLTRGYQLCLRYLLHIVDLEDTETGCKFFRREAILPILDACEDPYWFWDTEIMVFSRLAGLRIAEVPSLFIRHPEFHSTVKPLRDSWRQFRALLNLRRRLQREGRLVDPPPMPPLPPYPGFPVRLNRP